MKRNILMRIPDQEEREKAEFQMQKRLRDPLCFYLRLCLSTGDQGEWLRSRKGRIGGRRGREEAMIQGT